MTQKKRRLVIRSTYEPNRLAETHLEMAYEKLMPIIKSALKANEKDNNEINKILLKK